MDYPRIGLKKKTTDCEEQLGTFSFVKDIYRIHIQQEGLQ